MGSGGHLQAVTGLGESRKVLWLDSLGKVCRDVSQDEDSEKGGRDPCEDWRGEEDGAVPGVDRSVSRKFKAEKVRPCVAGVGDDRGRRKLDLGRVPSIT